MSCRYKRHTYKAGLGKASHDEVVFVQRNNNPKPGFFFSIKSHTHYSSLLIVPVSDVLVISVEQKGETSDTFLHSRIDQLRSTEYRLAPHCEIYECSIDTRGV